jgi:hypothetical protein
MKKIKQTLIKKINEIIKIIEDSYNKKIYIISTTRNQNEIKKITKENSLLLFLNSIKSEIFLFI